MMMERGFSERGFVACLLVAATLLAGLYVAAWRYWQPNPIPERAAPEVRQPDHSLVLEKRPDLPAAPAQKVPRGTTPVRVVQVKVAPKPPVPRAESAAAGSPPDGADCPPVTVDLTLVREPDGGQRVIASSPDGDIISGLDVPLVALQLPPARPWAAGVSYDLQDRRYGGWIDRDVGPLRIGLELQTDAQGISGRLRAGVRF